MYLISSCVYVLVSIKSLFVFITGTPFRFALLCLHAYHKLITNANKTFLNALRQGSNLCNTCHFMKRVSFHIKKPSPLIWRKPL